MRGNSASNAIVHSQQSVIDVQTVSVPKQRFAFLFDPDGGFFKVANDQDVSFSERLVDQPHKLFNRLFIDFNYQGSKELVEFIFQAVFFDISNYDRELHGLYLSHSTCNLFEGIERAK